MSKTRYAITLLAAMLFAGVTLAGSSGITNSIKQQHQPRIGGGANSLQDAIITEVDEIITYLDNLTTGTNKALTGTTLILSGDATLNGDVAGDNDTVVTGISNVTQVAGSTLFNGGTMDATGAVDMDYGTADITDHTFTSDGGTVILDGEITTLGRFAVTGPDASTGQMILGAAVTSTSVAVQTNTFATAFASGATPIITCTYTEAVTGSEPPIQITTIASNQFICTVEADKNFNYIAIGNRP